MIITLDGPAGSGKSTLAQLLAQRLGFFYINSGYLYRSVAYVLVHEFGYNEEKLHTPNIEDVQLILHEDNFMYQYQDGLAQVFFKGQEITQHLKDSGVSYGASLVSAYLPVRDLVAQVQKKFGTLHNLVTDGRDCGTEIYPKAQFKFYITASPQVRAQRMQADCEKKGKFITFEQALEMTQSRDLRDMTRSVCPLRKADQAIEIDTSHQSVDQLLEELLTLIEK